MIRVVFDANIYISALVFGGPPRSAIEIVRRRECQGFVSPPIVDEVREVLIRKFRWPSVDGEERVAAIFSFFQSVSPQQVIRGVISDDSDHRILECAMAAKADIIVSGDHHLLDLKRYEEIEILTCRDFLDRMAAPAVTR